MKHLKFESPSSEIQARFVREARVCALLDRHPGIVGVHGLAHDEETGRMFMALQLAGPRTLLDEIVDLHDQGWNSEKLRRLVRALAEACDAVHYANTRGVIHRDPKPSNILLDSDDRVTVIDWGICRVLDEPEDHAESPERYQEKLVPMSQSTVFGPVVGTPAYMSPEQLGGDRDIDARTDVRSG